LCKLLHAGDVGGEEVDAASVEVSAGAVVVLIGARAGVARNDAPSATACKFVGRAILSEAEGDLDVAGHWYARAADAWTALPRPYDALLARERRSRSELTSAARVESLGDLAEVEKGLRELGARWDADRVAQVLRQHGVEVTRTWRRGPKGYGDSLSPRELEVVQLVAQGMTNKQIAEALFISPKTVSRHLSTSMRKVSVTSRTALAMAANEKGQLGRKSNH